MAITMGKAVTELTSILKKQKFPGEPKKTYWNILSEQLSEEGTWDNGLIDQVKEDISRWLEKLKKNDLQNLWDESEIAAEEYADEDSPDSETVIEELSDELLDLVLNRMADSTPREEYYISEAASTKKKLSEDDDFEDDIKDDLFDEDEIDDFDSDDFFDDERF